MQMSWRTHNSQGGTGRRGVKRCRSLDSANEGKGNGNGNGDGNGTAQSVAVSEETADTITKANKQTSKQLVRQNCRPKNARAADKLTAFWFWVFGLVWFGLVRFG